MNDDLTKARELARELSKKTREIYCFVGAGLSIAAGLPSWEELLMELGKHLEVENYPDKDQSIADFKCFCRDKNFLDAGEVYKKSKIRYEEKQRLLKQLLLSRPPLAAHMALVRFGFSGILTTNYDHLLEDAYASVFGRSILSFLGEDFLNEKLFLGKDFFIAKVHGDAARWNTMVIGTTDYERYHGWTNKAKELVKNKIVLVLGISGTDSLINDFLIRLDESTSVILIMDKETKKSFELFLRARPKAVRLPNNFDIKEFSHSSLQDIILNLRPSLTDREALHDCEWGQMPPVPSLAPSDNDNLRNSLFSFQSRAVYVKAQKGYGLSSRIALAITDRVRRGDVLIYRLEGKDWLPTDAYVLDLLGALPLSAYNDYASLRRNATNAWTAEREGEALAITLGNLAYKIIIVIEHADRLRPDAGQLLAALIRNAKDNVIVVITSCGRNPIGGVEFKEVACDEVAPEVIQAICIQRGLHKETVKGVTAVNSNLDLHTLILASSLIDSGKNTLQDLKTAIRKQNSRALIDLAIKDFDPTTLRVLEISVLFRSLRSVELIQSCWPGANQNEIEKALQTICETGLLIHCPKNNAGNVNYAMSTTIREILFNCLAWEKAHKIRINSQIGHHYEKLAREKLSEIVEGRRALCKAIPFLSTAFHYYSNAENRESYLALLGDIYPDVVRMYHSEALKDWLKGVPGTEQLGSANQIELEIHAVRAAASLTRIESCPSDYAKNSNKLEELVELLIKKGGEVSKRIGSVVLYKGIAQTMMRNYEEAYSIFDDALKKEHIDGSDCRKIELRMIQTLFSLGRLDEAEARIKVAEATVTIPSMQPGNQIYCRKDLHSAAMIQRHKSTLNTLRLQFYDQRPDAGNLPTKDALYHAAVRYAESCDSISRWIQDCTDAQEPDRTGCGVAKLKLAQAHFAFGKYHETVKVANEAAGLLTAFPNNRWWRMCCYDLAARAQIKIRGDKLSAAEKSLEMAKGLWEGSSKEDSVRECELACSHAELLLVQCKT